MFFRKEVGETEEIPKWYGDAYLDVRRHVWICYPIPLNWIVCFLRVLHIQLMRPFFFPHAIDFREKRLRERERELERREHRLRVRRSELDAKDDELRRRETGLRRVQEMMMQRERDFEARDRRLRVQEGPMIRSPNIESVGIDEAAEVPDEVYRAVGPRLTPHRPGRAEGWASFDPGPQPILENNGIHPEHLMRMVQPRQRLFRTIGDNPAFANELANRESAAERSKQLLLDHLDETQKKQFEEEHSFIVTGSLGNRYRIFNAPSMNINRLDEFGQALYQFCLVPRNIFLPIFDQMLAQKLMIETDEPRFLEEADITCDYEQQRRHRNEVRSATYQMARHRILNQRTREIFRQINHVRS